ncbi:MAG: IS1595 family transposase [Bacteroidales bacterium]|nr:IS1595 family transposase [Bacteroidales bacterium]
MPRLSCNHIIKNGLQNGMQNYRCKDCGRQFKLLQVLLFTGYKERKMLDYIRCMVAGKSLRACAKVGINLPTSFAWRHKILAALQSFEDNINFFGVVEMDELLMDYSEKGRIYKNAEELKRARKQKPKKVAVLAATDRAGNLLFKKFDGKKLSSEQIEQFLKAKMPKDGVMCSSNKKAFKKVRRNVIKHKEIVTSHRQKRGIYSLSTVKKKASEFTNWIYFKFRGVATKYLQNYIMWYVVMGKYLTGVTVSNTGRILNLASSDRWAWYRYRELVNITYVDFNIY